MIMKTNFILMLALAAGLFFTACKKESEDEEPTPDPVDYGYAVGILISNEGAFGQGNGSISYFDTDKNTVTNNLFKTVNSLPLGDVVQSVYRGETYTYACVNASNKIEVIDSKTFESIATIENIPQPRYAVENNGKLYVSCWGNGGQVKIIDIETNSITDSIIVGSGPEGVLITNNTLYVANSGGFGADSTISVIDLNDNSSTVITLDAYNPAALVLDAGGNLWALAKGNILYDASWNPIGHNPSKLFSINTTSNSVGKTIDLFSDKHPTKLDISKNKERLYYGSGYGFDGIYKINIHATSAESNAHIDGSYYGFLINKYTDEIFALTGPFGANGLLIRYTSEGEKIDENEVGIFPNGGASKRMNR